MTRLSLLALTLLLATTPACSSTQPVADTQAEEATTAAPDKSGQTVQTPITPDEVSGAWSGTWGTLVLRTQPDGSVLGVFDKNQGTFIGSLQGDLLKGWWCQGPTRQLEDDDAGVLEARFLRKGTALMLEGKLRPGFEGPWDDSMNLAASSDDPSDDLLGRFDQDELFCTMPKAPSAHDMEEAADDEGSDVGMDDSDD